MKKCLLFMFLFINLNAKTGKVNSDCSVNGKKLFGYIQIVDTGEDITVQNVTTGEDLKVEVVRTGPSNCGQWLFINTGANLKIKFVTTGADLHIQFVTTGAGLN
jgi:hypothetical protein